MTRFAISSQWLAQTSSSSSSQQITIRDATYGRLQCTLRHNSTKNTKQAAALVVHRLTVHDTILVGEATSATTTADETTTTAIVWDLTRGVLAFEMAGIVSACCAGTSSSSSSSAVGTNNNSKNHFYVLKQKEHTDKLIVYEYTGGGTIVRKVKAGKILLGQQQQQQQQQPPLLLVTDRLLVVVQQSEPNGKLSWRMMDVTTGSKQAKASTGMVHEIVVVANHYAFGIVLVAASNKTLFCLNLMNGTVMNMSNINNLPNDIQQLQVAERRGGGGGFYLLVNNSQLYLLEQDEEEDDTFATATLHCELPNDNNSNQYMLHSDRLIAVHADNGTVQHIYLDLETLPKELEAAAAETTDAVMNDAAQKEEEEEETANKRKQSRVVLGPGQAGSLSKADVEHDTKRTKTTGVGVVSESSDHDATTTTIDNELTIAERLLQLEQAADDLEASDEENDKTNKDSILTASALTTESLHQLLSQGLQSGDKTLVETCLKVNDRTVIRSTCRELNPAQAQRLLWFITDRIAARPNRGERLAAWLSCIIPAITSPEDLKPLHNLIQDRLQVYPRLMHLQGRLQYLESSEGQ